MTATSTGRNLTLYQIQTELLELLELRDEIAGQVIVAAEAEAERKEQLAVIEKSIAEYVRREVSKVDNIVGLMRECKSRAAAIKAEEQRLAGLRRTWESREESIKGMVAEAMAATVDPAAIAEATQNQIIKKLSGRIGELKLTKSPPSVEVTSTALLPRHYQTVNLKMRADVWDIGVSKHLEAFVESGAVELSEGSPVLRDIAADLKPGKCPRCAGCGTIAVPGMMTYEGDPLRKVCPQCEGSGEKAAAVAGARLVNDAVHIRFS